MSDLLFRNCNYIDPETGITRLCDVSVIGEKISSVEPHEEGVSRSARQIIQCDGKYLFPGFIDLHTHLFAHGSTFGMDADRLPASGITTAVDMGTAGWVNYPAFHKCDIEGKKIRLKSFLNVSPIGQPGKGISEPLTDDLISEDEIANVRSKWPDDIVGLKVRISRNIVGDLGLRPLERAVMIGDKLALPVCVHTTDPPCSAAEIASILRPGDIYSHTYHGQGNTILDDRGSVIKEIRQAQERGVLMEVGNGKKNFDFRVAEVATKEGLFPDLITSDSTPATFHNDRSMWDLAFVMSKFLALGMRLSDVIRSVTETPAKVLGLQKQIGTVKEGYQADLALCELSEEVTFFRDSSGNRRSGHLLIKPYMTLRKGKVVFNSQSA